MVSAEEVRSSVEASAYLVAVLRPVSCLDFCDRFDDGSRLLLPLCITNSGTRRRRNLSAATLAIVGWNRSFWRCCGV